MLAVLLTLVSWLCAVCTGALSSAPIDAAPALDEVRLWSGPAPGARGEEPHDIPTLTPFLPEADAATGAAFVVCPGGGYGALAPHEGKTYARWLNDLGIAAFVLKYRLGRDGYRHPVMLRDAARAVRLVRSRASSWKVDPDRVGIIGSSAGGHLAATLMTRGGDGDAEASDAIERQSSRPTLGVLCYPVITMGELGHRGSRRNLLGREPSAELIAQLSAERQVTAATPPCFLWHTAEDRGVPVQNSYLFAAALATHGVQHELHVYEKGRHGLGLGVRDYSSSRAGEDLHPWAAACARWLRARGFAR